MPTVVLIWIWFCAYLNCAGWTLSVLHQLNPGGYAIALLLWFVALFVWRQKTSALIFKKAHWQGIINRFRKPFPLAFLILAAIAFLGGAIYAPTNYDALAYRVPRVLHWLAADQWQWIHTIFPRINNRSCGIEWVSAPFIALFKTDRFLFLINSISFLFLPGLVFSVFTRLGAQRRVAWHWMWIAPTGYCFLLQAGSIGNDLFGAVFALAAVDSALRAKISGSSRDIFASVLAAALMTSAKLSSLPLLLPWAIAILPSLKLFFRWPLKTFAVCVVAIFASVLPTMVLNAKFSSDWSGADLNRSGVGSAIALRTGANVIGITVQNLVPPVFPPAGKWNDEVKKHIPEGLESSLRAVMVEPQAYEFSVPDMQIEENAGLGFGVSMLVVVSFLRVRFWLQARTDGRRDSDPAWLVFLRWSPAVALLALMTQYNLSCFARILTPYYLLLLPILLVACGHERLVKERWWRSAAFTVFIIGGGLLVVSPARPLFPAQTIFGKIAAHASNSKLLARMKEVYLVYGNRNDGFAPARDALPPDLKILGLITFDDPETSLWRPFGSRRTEHICPGDTAADLKARGVEYILLREQALGQWFNCSLDDWLEKMNAQVIKKIPLNLRASSGPLDWYLVKLN
jgi:hypothetical protein